MASHEDFNVESAALGYDISVTDYLRQNKTIQGVCIRAVLYGGGRMLLVQRAAHDFAGSLWEIPGGACEENKDKTVLHAVSREVLEETALHVRSIRRLADIVEFQDTAGVLTNFRWRKLTFEVEVTEGHGLQDAHQQAAISQAVRLDPNEHQNWTWASEADVKKGKWRNGDLIFMGPQQTTIL